MKIACLPAVIVPWKIREMFQLSEKRILIDACELQCGAKLIEREAFSVDCHMQLTSELGVTKVEHLPSKQLEEKV